METLNRRNTETVELKLKEMNDRIYEQQILINSFQSTISMLSHRINEVEKMVLNFKVKITGNGASVI